jgi:hypothetical protein
MKRANKFHYQTLYARLLRYPLPYGAPDSSFKPWIALFSDDNILNRSTEPPDTNPNWIRCLNLSLSKDILLKLGFQNLYNFSGMRSISTSFTLLEILARTPTKALQILISSPMTIGETMNSSPSLTLLSTKTIDKRLTKALSIFTIKELDKLVFSTIKIGESDESLMTILINTPWDSSYTYSKIENLCNLFLKSADKIDLGKLPRSTNGNDLLRLLQNYLPQPQLLRYTNTELTFFKRQGNEAKIKRVAEELGTDYLQDIGPH